MDFYNKSLRKLASRRWECIENDCFEPAINSHLLQKSVYLKKIAPDGALYSYRIKFLETRNVTFKKLGLKDALSYKTFCQYHDNQMFKGIEEDQLDFQDYRTQCLLSYRSVMTEIRKKEIKQAHTKQLFSYVRKNSKLGEKQRRTLQEISTQSSERWIKPIEDLQQLASDLRLDLETDSIGFKFYSFQIEYHEICLISNFNFIEGNSYHRNMIFLHLLPDNNKLAVIIGCPKDCDVRYLKYVENFIGFPENVKFEYITDILFTKVENWVVSKDFYERRIRTRLKYIKEILSLQFDLPIMKSVNQRLLFNIFED